MMYYRQSVVYYMYNKVFFFVGHITLNVQKAIQEFHRKTCLRFVSYNSAYHRNYIEFGNDDG